MKKALILTLVLVFFLGCSQDVEISPEIESVDLTKIINPDTARAAAEFDNATNGIYKGVFVSDDLTYHGVLTVNFANDSQYNAILEYGDNRSQKMGFVGVNIDSESTSNLIEFRGKNARFTLDVSDYSKPVFSDGYIDGQGVQARLLKETSTNQVRATLGTFTDDDGIYDIVGTWDMLGRTIRFVPYESGGNTYQVPVINVGLVVITKDGTMYEDSVMEEFTPGGGCAAGIPELPPGPQMPFFSGPQTLSPPLVGDINEYAAAMQTSDIAGIPATWSLFYSKRNGDKYFDIDCNELIGGGTWSWNLSTGRILVTP